MGGMDGQGEDAGMAEAQRRPYPAPILGFEDAAGCSRIDRASIGRVYQQGEDFPVGQSSIDRCPGVPFAVTFEDAFSGCSRIESLGIDGFDREGIDPGACQCCVSPGCASVDAFEQADG